MVSKLNYSKWDNLELSDDSDIEVHPNVDKASFIRWKQRDIHEKREMRKVRRSQLEAELRTNVAVRPLLENLNKETQLEGSKYFAREVSRLSAGRQERGNKDGPDGPTLDDILLSLLLQINEEPGVKSARDESVKLDSALVNSLRGHLARISKRNIDIEKELAEMSEEDKKKITSDSLHEGWSTGHISKDPAPEKESSTHTVREFETLNPGATKNATLTSPADRGSDNLGHDDEEPPPITPLMKEFASLPSSLASVPLSAESLGSQSEIKTVKLGAFETMFHFLGSHKELLRPSYGTTDALLVQAFQSQMAGQNSLARMCTEKALLVQYCNKLGPDGVSLFFQRYVFIFYLTQHDEHRWSGCCRFLERRLVYICPNCLASNRFIGKVS